MTRTTAQRVLIVIAAGGIGTTICELGQLGGLVMYGVEASRILNLPDRAAVQAVQRRCHKGSALCVGAGSVPQPR